METREQRPPNGPRGNGGAHGLGERLDKASQAAGQTWSRARDTYTPLDRLGLDLRREILRNRNREHLARRWSPPTIRAQST